MGVKVRAEQEISFLTHVGFGVKALEGRGK
jgi:hypothetical protein